MPPTFIPLARQKYLLQLGFAGLFMGIGAVFMVLAFAEGQEEPGVSWAVGIVLLGFFGYAAWTSWRKYQNDVPGVTLTDQGIEENTTSLRIGLIPWRDVVGLECHSILGNEFVMVMLRNPKAYLAKANTPAERKLMRINLKLYDSPIAIMTNALTLPFDEIVDLIEARWEANRAQTTE